MALIEYALAGSLLIALALAVRAARRHRGVAEATSSDGFPATGDSLADPTHGLYDSGQSGYASGADAVAPSAGSDAAGFGDGGADGGGAGGSD